MVTEPERIITLDGIQYHILQSGLGPVYLPIADSLNKKDFPVDGSFRKSFFSVSRGIASHSLNPFSASDDREFDLPEPFSTSDDAKMGLPATTPETTFSAKHLNLLSDDDFFPECWEVLMANGWASDYGDISDSTLKEVCAIDGNDIVEKSKHVFGDGWGCYVLERASIHLTEPLTRVWYAANMLSAFYARNDYLLFGYLLCEYRLKMRVEKTVRTGSKVIAGTKSAAEQTNAVHSVLRNKRFALMQELVPTIGPDKAAIECELRGLGKAQAVKRQWNRFQNKKRDT